MYPKPWVQRSRTSWSSPIDPLAPRQSSRTDLRMPSANPWTSPSFVDSMQPMPDPLIAVVGLCSLVEGLRGWRYARRCGIGPVKHQYCFYNVTVKIYGSTFIRSNIRERGTAIFADGIWLLSIFVDINDVDELLAAHQARPGQIEKRHRLFNVLNWVAH